MLAALVKAEMSDEMSGSGSLNMTLYENQSNETLSCAAENIQGPVELPYPPALTITLRAFYIAYTLLIIILGAILNSLVAYLIIKFEKLHNLENGIALQIVINDLIGCTALLAGVVSAIANQWLLGEVLCNLWGSFYLGLNMIRRLLLTAFILDRFCNIFLPFAYPKHRNKIVIVTIAAMYIFALVISIVPIVYDCNAFSVATWICRFTPRCGTVCAGLRQFTVYGIFVGFTGILPFILYIILFCKAKKLTKVAGSDEARRSNRAITITFFLMFFTVFFVTPFSFINAVATAPGINVNPSKSLWLYIVNAFTLNTFFVPHVLDATFLLRNRDLRKVMSKVSLVPKAFSISEKFEVE